MAEAAGSDDAEPPDSNEVVKTPKEAPPDGTAEEETPKEAPPGETAEETDIPQEEIIEPVVLPDPTEADGQSYKISEFTFHYAAEHTQHLPLDMISAELVAMDLELGQTTGGYVAPREGAPTATLTLVGLAGTDSSFYPSAINIICARTVVYLNGHGLIGIHVAPNVEDITPQGRDLRDPENTVLRLVISTAVVGRVRTVASGQRIAEEDRLDSSEADRLHARIKGNSPIQDDDLIRKDLLDDYIWRLNRHPGRRADAALSSAAGGKVILDYLITESRPWMAYSQISNTGTKQTDEWRERFGFVNNQLTKNDDILSFDYITAGFDESHALSGSYETSCFLRPRRLRWRVFGAWSKFDASQVGIVGETFEGEEWSAGGELILNAFQHRHLFIDAVAGARWRHIEVINYDIPTGMVLARGSEEFFLPYVGLRVERIADTAVTQGSVTLEWTDSSVAGTDSTKIAQLGRLFTDEDWTVVQWDFVQTFFIDSLLKGKAWKDPSSDKATLAHEVAVSTKGQYAFGHRLIPQCEGTIGGLYTVRGYPESFVAGDNVVVGSVEYRFHLPRNLPARDDPGVLLNKPFRYRRQQAYGRPDWDLLFRVFFDAGRTTISSARPGLGEEGQTLASTGVGVELQLKRNINIRVDYGIALEGAATSSERVQQGDGRAHVVATLLW